MQGANSVPRTKPSHHNVVNPCSANVGLEFRPKRVGERDLTLGNLWTFITLAAALLHGASDNLQLMREGQPFTLSFPVGLYGHHFDVSVSGTPAGGGTSISIHELLGNFGALFSLAASLQGLAASAIDSMRTGKTWSVSGPVGLYGHHYTLSLSGSPA